MSNPNIPDMEEIDVRLPDGTTAVEMHLMQQAVQFRVDSYIRQMVLQTIHVAHRGGPRISLRNDRETLTRMAFAGKAREIEPGVFELVPEKIIEDGKLPENARFPLYNWTPPA